MITEFAAQIVGRLTLQAGPRAQVGFMPENIGTFSWFTHVESAYLVHYTGSNFGKRNAG